MSRAPESTSILLVDDGELEDVAAALTAAGHPFQRYRGGQIPDELAPPEDLLIVTPRRLERIRRGSPPNARPGYPLRIVAVGEDSPAMRRRLRRHGLHLLVRLPAANSLWSLLVERALYRGEERRRDPRVSVGSKVHLSEADAPDRGVAADAGRETNEVILLDLSNRGCRIQSSAPLKVGEALSFSMPTPSGAEDDGEAAGPEKMLTLSGVVRRLVQPGESGECRAAVVFDDDLSDATRQRLTETINHWASGTGSLAALSPAAYPSLPPRALASMPELMLDDETDPPVRSRETVHVALEPEALADPDDSNRSERRGSDRGVFDTTVLAENDDGPMVLIGRDLSPGGMKVEPMGELRVGDRFQIGLHGPSLSDPFVVDAEVVRDDGDDGYALAFRDVDADTSHEIEKLVACLPGVESLIEGELASMGAVLSQIIRR